LPSCCLNVIKVKQEFAKIKSDEQKLKAINEHILIRFLGISWNKHKAYHPWFHSGQYFSPAELFKHLIEGVISLSDTLDVPTEAPAPSEIPRRLGEKVIDILKCKTAMNQLLM
jgi:hypothetical protein